MKILTYTPLLLLFVLQFELKAQNQLSIDSAIALVLKNNYNILIAANNAQIAKTNNSIGNAGMLPNVAASASNNYANNSINQKLSNGNEIVNPSATTNSLNGSVALNWTVFDGCKIFTTKKKLNEIEAQGELQYKDQVLQSVADVITAYYTVVKQKQQLLSLQEAINYNTERVKILQASQTAGLQAKNTLLQAKIDLNVYRENAINQQATIAAAKRALGLLISHDTLSNFEVYDSIPLSYSIDKNEITKKLYATNPKILAYQRQIAISKLSLNEYKALRYIKLNLSAAYNYLQTENSAGNLLLNNSQGPAVGASLSIPIFQSGNITRQIKVARLQLSSDTYMFENLKLQLNTDLQNALYNFETQQQLLEIEKENNLLAKENLDIALKRLQQGQTTALEARQAQESFVDSNTRLINFRFSLKLAETKLRQLLNQL